MMIRMMIDIWPSWEEKEGVKRYLYQKLEKSEYAVTPFKLNEMPKINEISHFAHIDYQAFAINDCAACF